MPCKVMIGTSGWHYDHWRGPFYPQSTPGSEMLRFYASHFDTVEVNNTFYNLPARDTFESWRQTVPAHFRFAVKASRFITHMKKLKDPQTPLDSFMGRVDLLGRKLGPVLFQLPPRWSCNLNRFESFMERLPSGHRYAFEMRDSSWHNDHVYRLLLRRRAAFCVYHLAGFLSPLRLTADFTYIRLHGPEASAYCGSYDKAALREWARRIKKWSQDLKAVYIYFDNDQAGYAVRNALSLKELVERPRQRDL